MIVLATIAVLAQETTRYGWDHHGGPWWPIFPLFWLLFWVGLFFFFGRSRRRWHHGHARHSGESVLAERYARGEIDEREYRERLDVLKRVGGSDKKSG